MAARNHRHRRPSLQPLRNDPRLVVYRPTTTTAGAGDHLDVPDLALRLRVGSSLDTSRSLSRSRISTITDQELHKKAAHNTAYEFPRSRPMCATRSRYQCSACSVETPGVLLGSENYTIQSRRGVTPLISHSLPIAVLLAAAKPSGYSLSTLESSNACPNVSTSRIRTGEGLHRRWRSRTANHRGNPV